MKYIFITGGVVSSLGKGLTAAALGAILETRGIKIAIQKFDPYLNLDPGTMNPFQHGEVYVLNDGAETDLDLGHYERFLNVSLSKKHSLSSGQVYASVLQKERKGDYLGKTVQVIPHITNEIKDRIYSAGEDVDIVITEIGGTVGDIEGLPFLEAMRQLALEVGKDNVLFIHVTLIPFIKASGELKSKPSQQSVAKFREIGIQPDILVCRTEHPLSLEIRQKLSLFCNVPLKSVIECKDVESSIYELPLTLHEEGLDTLVVDHLGLKVPPANMSTWQNVLERLHSPIQNIRVGVVGKYMDLSDAYKSVFESLIHAGIANQCRIEIVKIDASLIEANPDTDLLKNVHAILIPGGFGDRGIEGKIKAAQFAREHNIPYLGICLGLQIAIIEFARNVCHLDSAHSLEFDLQTPHPVIDNIDSQKSLTDKGATMRLGSFACNLQKNSHSFDAYNTQIIYERHRHRFKINQQYESVLEKNGMQIIARNEDQSIAEAIELKNHPWFVGVQFHPEFQSKPHKPHPLFVAFIKKACELLTHQ